MQRIAVALALCSLAFFARPTEVHAADFQLGIDVGMNLALEEFAGAGLGIGLNPGIVVAEGLAIELNMGLDRYVENNLRFRFFPLQIGVRYRAELGSITPFGYAHFGVARTNVKVQGTNLFGFGTARRQTNAAINAGGGVEFALSDTMGIGVQAGISNVFGVRPQPLVNLNIFDDDVDLTVDTAEARSFTNLNVGLVMMFAL